MPKHPRPSDESVAEWILRLACRKLAERLLAEHEAEKREKDKAESPGPEPTARDAEKGEAG